MDTLHPLVLAVIPLVIGTAVIVGIVLLNSYSQKRFAEQAEKLLEDHEYELIDLWKNGFVLTTATGQDITRIRAQVCNQTRKRLRISISIGTYFMSNGRHQNMVTRVKYLFTLHPEGREDLCISAACINATLPIPGGQDGFCGVARVSDDLIRFLTKAKNADEMVIQAGVWAITDRYSKSDIQTKLIAQSSSGASRSAVSDSQVGIAKEILTELNIPNRL